MTDVLDARISDLRAALAEDGLLPHPSTGGLSVSPGEPSTFGQGQDPNGVILNPRDFRANSDQGNSDGTLAEVGPAREYQSEIFSDWPSPSPTKVCPAVFRKVRGCGCGVKVVADFCDNLECSRCETRNRQRRKLGVKDRFEAGLAGRALNYTVFTVPEHLRSPAADPKVWHKWLERLIRYMKKHLAFDFGCERSDPAGEDGEKWHPHVNLLWVRRRGFRPFIQPSDLAALKEKWASIIGQDAGKPVDVWTEFKTTAEQQEHAYSYIARAWPRWADKCKYLLRVKWFGKPPKTPKRDLDTHCHECGLEIKTMKCGTQEAAEALAARGYENLLEECQERRRAFLRAKPSKWEKRGCLVIDLG